MNFIHHILSIYVFCTTIRQLSGIVTDKQALVGKDGEYGSVQHRAYFQKLENIATMSLTGLYLYGFHIFMSFTTSFSMHWIFQLIVDGVFCLFFRHCINNMEQQREKLPETLKNVNEFKNNVLQFLYAHFYPRISHMIVFVQQLLSTNARSLLKGSQKSN